MSSAVALYILGGCKMCEVQGVKLYGTWGFEKSVSSRGRA